MKDFEAKVEAWFEFGESFEPHDPQIIAAVSSKGFVCQYPEQPLDGDIWSVDHRCAGCMIGTLGILRTTRTARLSTFTHDESIEAVERAIREASVPPAARMVSEVAG